MPKYKSFREELIKYLTLGKELEALQIKCDIYIQVLGKARSVFNFLSDGGFIIDNNLKDYLSEKITIIV